MDSSKAHHAAHVHDFNSSPGPQEADRLNEASPLLSPVTAQDESTLPMLLSGETPPRQSSESSWTADPDHSLENKSSWYLFLLTLTSGGLQLAWAVELSYGSPYLLSLGISKSMLAIVWIAGPLSGMLMQPWVGIKSDRCRSRFGKRRPFMVAGATATILSLLLLAWTREIVASVLHVFGVPGDSQAVSTTAICFAVLMIYVLDFSINAIMAGMRAFIVDNAPSHQQDTANAWAGRLAGIGNIIEFLFGFTNLPEYLWFLGNTQLKVLCVIASVGLSITVAVSCSSITERDPRLEREPEKQETGVFAFFKELFHAVSRLPPQIKNVCIVQLAAWMGWFPFLFYTTTYVSEVYVNNVFRDNPNMTPEEIDDAIDRGTRLGTFALMIFSITYLVAIITLPWFIVSLKRAPTYVSRTPMSASPTTNRTPDESRLLPPAQSTSRKTRGCLGAFQGSWNIVVDCSSDLTNRLPSLQIPGLTLRRAWMLGHLMFAALMLLTLFARTTTAATILIALVGIPWAVSGWAPFALIAAEISRRDAIRRGLVRPPPTPDGELLARGEDPSAGADQAGVVLGIHNVSIAAPQVVATLVSSAIFKALQKSRGATGDDSVAWVMSFGGCCSLVAAWLIRRVGDEE